MMFDDIQEVADCTDYIIKDQREAIEAVKEMQGGFRAAKALARLRGERELVDSLIKIVEAYETTLKSFPPAGTYRRIK